MKFLNFFLVITAATASAIPQPLEARDGDATLEIAAKGPTISYLPGKSIRCGGRDPRASTYNVGTIKSAAQAAFQHVLDNTQVGANHYPHTYGYRDPTVHFPDSVCKHGDTLYEFPILTHGIYTGQDVRDLADRVVIKKKSKNEAYYCGLITHIGAPAQPGVAAPFTSCSG